MRRYRYHFHEKYKNLLKILFAFFYCHKIFLKIFPKPILFLGYPLTFPFISIHTANEREREREKTKNNRMEMQKLESQAYMNRDKRISL